MGPAALAVSGCRHRSPPRGSSARARVLVIEFGACCCYVFFLGACGLVVVGQFGACVGLVAGQFSASYLYLLRPAAVPLCVTVAGRHIRPRLVHGRSVVAAGDLV